MRIVVGFSLGASVLFLRYRDLNQVWDVVVQAGSSWRRSSIRSASCRSGFTFYLYLWPPTPIIEFSRAVLVTGRHADTRRAPVSGGRAARSACVAGIAGLPRARPARRGVP